MSTATEQSADPAPDPAPQPAKRKRGTETVRDMVLSLIAVFAVILPFYWLAGLSDDEKGGIKPVDPSPQYAALRQAVPGVPVPTGLPKGWVATSSTLDGSDLRVGYVTPGGGYAEYAAHGDPAGTFLADQTGKGHRVTSLKVGARDLQVWSDDKGATSLVLQHPGWTVVVGGLREDAEDDEVQALAASLR